LLLLSLLFLVICSRLDKDKRATNTGGVLSGRSGRAVMYSAAAAVDSNRISERTTSDHSVTAPRSKTLEGAVFLTTVSSAGTEAEAEAVVPTSVAAAVVVVVILKRHARADRREGVALELDFTVYPAFEFELASTGRIVFPYIHTP
jgi:hypothetical protein